MDNTGKINSNDILSILIKNRIKLLQPLGKNETKHQLLSRTHQKPFYIIGLFSGVPLIIFIIMLFYYYPDLKLSTSINGTLFAALLSGIFLIIGTIFKAVYDSLDAEKKKNESLLEKTINDVEKYYYPLALASQSAASHLIETVESILELQNTKEELVHDDASDSPMIEGIAGLLSDVYANNRYRLAYCLFLIGIFYYHKQRLEIDKGGDIILRNWSREIFLKTLYSEVKESINLSTKDETIYLVSILQDHFVNNAKGEQRIAPYTFPQFCMDAGLFNIETNKSSELSGVYREFEMWLEKKPKEVLVWAHHLEDYGIWIERYVRELSKFWYHDNAKQAEHDKLLQEKIKGGWETNLKNIFSTTSNNNS